MTNKRRKISLPLELNKVIDQRVKHWLSGNASDVIRAGKQFEKIMAALPQDPITPEIEQDVERRVRRARTLEKKRRK